MIHALGKSRRFAAVATDLLLAFVFVANLATRAQGPLSRVVMVAIPAILAWGVLTLHHPREVEIDDAALSFRAYGRTHRFPWSAIERLHIRRFLVRDRVLVRITPSPPWRGRYWLLHGFDRWPELVAELEARGALLKRSHRQT